MGNGQNIEKNSVKLFKEERDSFVYLLTNEITLCACSSGSTLTTRPFLSLIQILVAIIIS